MFEPTWESVRTHQVPDWYHDAKLGVFLHWGRFTAAEDAVFALLLDGPGTRRFALRGVDASGAKHVSMLGLVEPVEWSVDGGTLSVELPERLPVAAAHALRIDGRLRPTGQR